VDFLDRKLGRNAQSLRSFPEFARGYYHFGTWWNARDTIKQDAETEAEFFYETCLAADPDAFSSGRLAPMLDVELTKKGSALGRQMSHDDVAAWVMRFCYRLDDLTGRPTGIYTGRYFLFGDPARKSNGLGVHHVSLFADRPLWLAQYSRRAEPPKPIDGWPAAMWQYTGSGSCKGIRGRVDRNKFLGSTAEWLELLGYPKVRGLPSWGEVVAATRNL
jgi:GH25 family lysozyme M1 (1,4-beta-N-acetylmuramidase)